MDGETKLPVKRAEDMVCMEIRDLASSRVLVLAVNPEIGDGSGGVKFFWNDGASSNLVIQ